MAKRSARWTLKNRLWHGEPVTAAPPAHRAQPWLLAWWAPLTTASGQWNSAFPKHKQGTSPTEESLRLMYYVQLIHEVFHSTGKHHLCARISTCSRVNLEGKTLRWLHGTLAASRLQNSYSLGHQTSKFKICEVQTLIKGEEEKEGKKHTSHIALLRKVTQQPPVSSITAIYDTKGKKHTQKSSPKTHKFRQWTIWNYLLGKDKVLFQHSYRTNGNKPRKINCKK